MRPRDPAPRHGAPREGERNDGEAEHGRGDDSQRHRRLAAGDSDGNRERERHPRGRLRQQERAVECEAPAARQKSPREETCCEREDGRDQDPVERRVAR